MIFEKAVIAWMTWFCLGVVLEQSTGLSGKWMPLDILFLATMPVLIGARALLLAWALTLSQKVLFDER